ncbi:hypothetical protein SAMN02927924_04475 [Sphingobium faniae]|nr:hypothetical protein SAMN02927924_04475 [Sphingobium faniae]
MQIEYNFHGAWFKHEARAHLDEANPKFCMEFRDFIGRKYVDQDTSVDWKKKDIWKYRDGRIINIADMFFPSEKALPAGKSSPQCA